MPWRVPLADLDYGEAEQAAVMDVLRSRWLTMGAVTRELEQRFAALVGVRHAVAVSSATAALHLACLALDIGPGDEVIVPSLSFVATANAVRYTGAQVRFADVIGPHDLTVSPASIRAQITPRSKAIIVMHYAGFPCRMPEIVRIARQHGLAVIEDAAHAPGARLDGTALGAWGEAGCFSFFSNKNLATGEGGMLVTDREEIARQARLLRSHGMTTLSWDRHQGHAHSYDVVGLGYNYRIDEIRAALGLAQLDKLARNNARRRAITLEYRRQLAGLPVELPFQDAAGEPAYHIFPILLPPGADRADFIERMHTAGIQTSIHYPPIHRFRLYHRRHAQVSLPITDDVTRREVTLPLYPTMRAEDVSAVVAAVRGSLKDRG